MTWIESRKVIRVGEKSYAVTIPKKWAELLGVKPGDVVDVTFDQSGLICIKPRRARSEEVQASRVAIGFEECGDLVDKCIAGCYTEGLDTVDVRLTSEEAMSKLSELPSKLPGVIVVEASEGRTIVKMALSEAIVGLDEVVNRMARVLEEMYDCMEAFLQTGSSEHMERLLRGDDELDRLFYLGLRLVKRVAATSLLEGDVGMVRELLDVALLLRSLEHVGDSLDRSVRVLHDMWPLDGGVVENLLALFRSSRKVVFDALYSYRRANMKIASKVLALRRELRSKIHEARKGAPPPLQAVLSELDLISTIAEDIIDIAVSRFVRELEKKAGRPQRTE